MVGIGVDQGRPFNSVLLLGLVAGSVLLGACSAAPSLSGRFKVVSASCDLAALSSGPYSVLSSVEQTWTLGDTTATVNWSNGLCKISANYTVVKTAGTSTQYDFTPTGDLICAGASSALCDALSTVVFGAANCSVTTTNSILIGSLITESSGVSIGGSLNLSGGFSSGCTVPTGAEQLILSLRRIL